MQLTLKTITSILTIHHSNNFISTCTSCDPPSSNGLGTSIFNIQVEPKELKLNLNFHAIHFKKETALKAKTKTLQYSFSQTSGNDIVIDISKYGDEVMLFIKPKSKYFQKWQTTKGNTLNICWS